MSVETTSEPASQQRVRQLERVIEISRVLTSTRELEPLLQTIIATAAELTGSEASAIILFDPKTGELNFAAAPQLPPARNERLAIPIEGSVAGWIFRNTKPLILSDARSDPRYSSDADEILGQETNTLLGVPLMIKDQPIGVIEAVNKVAGEFTPDDVELLTTLAAQAAIAIENARLMSALQNAYDELSRLEKMKSDFIAIASHELRTPLGLILGYASYLRETAAEELAGHLDAVVRSAMRLKGIIEDLSNLGHIEEGEAKLRREVFVYDELIREVVAEAQSLAKAKDLDVQVNFRDTQLKLNADRDKIRQVLTNILNNAIRFTPDGGQINITARRVPGYIKTSVEDTGIGIREDQLERIFERFYQVESHLTRKQGGMGLGLSIAKAMVEMHDGQITAESAEGRGSIFHVALPVGVNADNEQPATADSAALSPD